jgi:hypothetical protein
VREGNILAQVALKFLVPVAREKLSSEPGVPCSDSVFRIAWLAYRG